MKERYSQPEVKENQEKTMEIPKPVLSASRELESAGFESYLVGGCVRDFLLERKPKDWDITTQAKPEEVQKIFTDSVYENQFGTVGVKTESDDPTLKIIEITTFRQEGKYTDKRHPDEITFAKTLKDDLSRRDFTINALAARCADGKKCEIIDLFGGQDDLENKLIRAVGNPDERFKEDALRLMRAIRFSAQLNFEIEENTAKAIGKNAGLIEFIAKERIAEELIKLIMSDNAVEGVKRLQESGLLKYVLPELVEGVGVKQNKHHIYTVFEHNLKSLAYAAENKMPLDLRLAALLHDVGKPRTKQGEGEDSTFYGHQIAGVKMLIEALDRLHFPKKVIDKVALLVREHMFVYDPETVTLKGVRRLLRRVGSENIEDLLKLREADRIGSGVPKAQPYRLRYLKAMIEKVKNDPISAKMLAITGEDVMKILKIEPGPKVGYILAVLLEEVLDDPDKNKEKDLKSRVKELGSLKDGELEKIASRAKQSAMDVQDRIDDELKKKYFVK